MIRNFKRRTLLRHLKSNIERFCFAVFGGFGLLPFLWRRCPVYPERPYWLMGITMLPLCLLTAVWVIAVTPIILTIGAIADVLAPKHREG